MPKELKRLMTVMANSRQFKVSDGRFSQVVADTLDAKLGDDLERLKKIRVN
ncbi:hypothetical protein BAE44_0025528 [Dichanthelium oligosanthes]|uniref:Uncharacterized protein n=1 Tax=Dichanthelium oligosanthes TaxID=888268 RepID=A0A1E5UKP9_9POAL|nr:hypothetical protein BAE44_0025528 [Dichanthelium oligosanthes]